MKNARVFSYLVYSFVHFSVIACLQLIPNRIANFMDYDVLFLPLLFFVYGIVSRIILKPYRFYYPIILPTVLTLIFAFYLDLTISIFELNPVGTCICYVGSITLGMMLVYAVEWMIGAIKSGINYYRK